MNCRREYTDTAPAPDQLQLVTEFQQTVSEEAKEQIVAHLANFGPNQCCRDCKQRLHSALNFLLIEPRGEHGVIHSHQLVLLMYSVDQKGDFDPQVIEAIRAYAASVANCRFRNIAAAFLGRYKLYLEERAEFSEGRLMDEESNAVMFEWENPLMAVHAKVVCSGGGDIGFGMGLVDTTIQSHDISSHTIIEAHPDVYTRMLATVSEQLHSRLLLARASVLKNKQPTNKGNPKGMVPSRVLTFTHFCLPTAEDSSTAPWYPTFEQ
ncbi:hypothetical protein R1flu_023775 [Riccia fluitans]|uniref:Uncharacterized protein n=1 Tax=Riccia fluitans TaxID=41844 RepID=A0ABD1XT02_9MARC